MLALRSPAPALALLGACLSACFADTGAPALSTAPSTSDVSVGATLDTDATGATAASSTTGTTATATTAEATTTGTTAEPTTAEPITTEGLRYGFRVKVLGMPCHRHWRSEAALKVVGPRYFGYAMDYAPIDAQIDAA